MFNLFLLKSHSNWVSFRPHKITLGYSLCLNRICEKIMEGCIIYMPSYLLVFMGNWYQFCLPPSIKTHRCSGPLWIGQVDITCTHHILLHTFTYYWAVVRKPSDIASGHMEILLDAGRQFYLNSSIPSQQVDPILVLTDPQTLSSLPFQFGWCGFVVLGTRSHPVAHHSFESWIHPCQPPPPTKVLGL